MNWVHDVRQNLIYYILKVILERVKSLEILLEGSLVLSQVKQAKCCSYREFQTISCIKNCIFILKEFL